MSGALGEARQREEEPRPAERGATGRWRISSHAEVVQALSTPAIGREACAAEPSPRVRGPTPNFAATITHWMIFRDAPVHTEARRVFLRALSAMGTKRLGARIGALVQELLAPLPRSGSFDLLKELAFPLPMRVIGELMGLPVDDGERLRRWSNTLAAAIDLAPTPDAMLAADRSALEMTEFLHEVFAERRSFPREDLVSHLVGADAPADGPGEAELVANCIFMLCAGHETTTNLIASGVLRLLQHPEQARILRERPEHWPSAVEECLRYDCPVQATSRIVQADCEVGGQALLRGEHVDILLGAASRDPAVFTDPRAFDVRRDPNPHLAFGLGPHFCVGAGLARMEGEIAIRACLERFPGLRLADEVPRWRPSVVFRGLERLAVEV